MFGTCSGFPAPELLETHAVVLRARAASGHAAAALPISVMEARVFRRPANTQPRSRPAGVA
jgi:hypothetical protein